MTEYLLDGTIVYERVSACQVSHHEMYLSDGNIHTFLKSQLNGLPPINQDISFPISLLNFDLSVP